jgi:hypothetical protein
MPPRVSGYSTMQALGATITPVAAPSAGILIADLLP